MKRKLFLTVASSLLAVTAVSSVAFAALGFKSSQTFTVVSATYDDKYMSALGRTEGNSDTVKAKVYVEIYKDGKFQDSAVDERDGKWAEAQVDVTYGKGKYTAKSNHKIWDAAGKTKTTTTKG
ncbi:hypothetical protein [Brevibacillus sp. Leaf182]|uniref:hypothetical protein n=1 Tax=Brevibacillus sp. Leaf182 TaxID=1736290 RepID=UPI0006F727D4|nr:hypothetical protein [Brevibacillus sp. Leaf182]RAT98673.1 hypothetical protein ASG16_003085 [Brevibacillus sp. Leaf182]